MTDHIGHPFSLRATPYFIICFLGMIGCDIGFVVNAMSPQGLYKSVGLGGTVVFLIMAFVAPFACWALACVYQVFEDALVRLPLFGLMGRETVRWSDLERVRVTPSLDNPKIAALYFRGRGRIEVSAMYFGFDQLLVFLVTRHKELFD